MKRSSNLIFGLIFVFGGLDIVVTGHVERFTTVATGTAARLAGSLLVVAGLWLVTSWLRQFRDRRR